MNRSSIQMRWKPVAILTSITSVLLSLLFLSSRSCGEAVPMSGPQKMEIPAIGMGPIPAPSEAAAKAPTQTLMRNVLFHIDRDAYLDIHSMRGEMASKTPGAPLNLDNKLSFVMKIDTARIGMRSASLDVLMNRYVFGYAHAPLRNIHVEPSGRQLKLTGIMHKLVDIHFTMWADVSASNGMIRIHPTKLDTFGFNGLSLMRVAGETLEKMLTMPAARGISAQGDDMLLDPARALPPPEISLHLSAVRVEDDELMMFFDAGRRLPELKLPHPEEKNTMFFRGGTLRMGKLLMVDVSMQVVDTDPGDPFDFYLDHYNDQLVAGFSQNQPDYGLLVFMRDFADLGKPARPGERLAP
jgi:hypothetical protein